MRFYPNKSTVFCDECGQALRCVMIGNEEGPEYAAAALVCLPCLRKAVALLEPEERESL